MKNCVLLKFNTLVSRNRVVWVGYCTYTACSSDAARGSWLVAQNIGDYSDSWLEARGSEYSGSWLAGSGPRFCAPHSMLRAPCSVLRALCSALRVLCSMPSAPCSALRVSCSVLRAPCAVLRVLCSARHAGVVLRRLRPFASCVRRLRRFASCMRRLRRACIVRTLLRCVRVFVGTCGNLWEHV